MDATAGRFKPLEILNRWVAPLVTAAVIAFFTTWLGDHVAFSQVTTKLDTVEKNTASLKEQTEKMSLELAQRPTSDEAVRRKEFEAFQKQLDSIERQVSEIRVYVMTKR